MNRIPTSATVLAVAAFTLFSGCARNLQPDGLADVAVTPAPAPLPGGAVAVDLSIARHDAPSAVRVHLVPNDEARSVRVGPDDVLCLSLMRHGSQTVLRIAAQAPQIQPSTELVLAGPGVEPGTYRTTPWQVLARVPTSTDTIGGSALSAAAFPRCPVAALVGPAQERNTGPSDA